VHPKSHIKIYLNLRCMTLGVDRTWFRFWQCTNWPILMMSNTHEAQRWCGVKINHYGNFHELSSSTYLKLIHTMNYSTRERLTNYIIIIFVRGKNYEWSHINDGILDIKGQCPTKRITTKCLGWNIIMTLRETKTSKTK
jgi:hypothetical protein